MNLDAKSLTRGTTNDSLKLLTWEPRGCRPLLVLEPGLGGEVEWDLEVLGVVSPEDMEALALPAPGSALETETPALHRTVTSGKYVELGKQWKSWINVSNIGCFVRTESVFCETSFFFSICLYWVNHHLRKIVCSHIHWPCLPGLNSRDIASLQLSFTFSTSPSVQYNTVERQGSSWC